ncbi:hypothetical protein [Neobacillus bataviensis]|uniref:hypothetical protein n=1 Tax=Neobacillus bataviensis TaxID=220685 RepID=UPI001CBC0A22|nr:hypothetical protein [Neobacillus bataviensis]
MNMEKIGHCRLCGMEGVLEDSHIVPRFIGRWLRKTSEAGDLRNPFNPNKPENDLLSIYLLCSKCEDMFNKSETIFSKKIFHKYQEGASKFDYDDWLINFVISLSWRIGTLYFINNSFDETNSKHLQLNEALNIWGSYLLGDGTNFGNYNHHLYFVDDRISELNVGYKFYLNRSVDGHVGFLPNGEMIIYCMLPGMLIVSNVSPKSRKGWKGTNINRFGTLQKNKQNGPADIANYMIDRAILSTYFLFSGMSERQKEKIKEKVSKKKTN